MPRRRQYRSPEALRPSTMAVGNREIAVGNREIGRPGGYGKSVPMASGNFVPTDGMVAATSSRRSRGLGKVSARKATVGSGLSLALSSSETAGRN